MRDMFEVGKFTVIELIKKKVFIITNIIIIIAILLILNINNILKLFDFDINEAFVENALVIDTGNLLENNTFENANIENMITVSVENEMYSTDKIKKLIEDKEYDYVVELTEANKDLFITYTSGNGETTYNFDFLLTNIKDTYVTSQLNKLNLTEEQLASITPNVELELVSTNPEAENGIVGSSIGILLSLAMFMGIYLFAYQVSGAVTTEKTSKIVETLLTSTSSKNIILGKTLGVGLLGISQIIFLILFTVIGAYIFLPTEIINSIVAEINLIVIIVSLIYFVLGYLLFSFLFALSGAMVNRLEDVSIVNTPVNLIAVLGFYLGYFTVSDPSGILNRLASYIPISSMFAMPSRFFMGVASTTDVIVSIIILIITIIFIAYVSIRIYSNAILNSGSKMNLKSLIKLFKQKDKI